MHQIPDSAIRARNALLLIFGIILLINVAIVAVIKGVPGITSLILTGALMWCVIQGYEWAKWVAVGLIFIAAAVVTALGVMIISEGGAVGGLFITFGALTSSIPVFLLFSKGLEIYFKEKRSERHR